MQTEQESHRQKQCLLNFQHLLEDSVQLQHTDQLNGQVPREELLSIPLLSDPDASLDLP